MLERKASMLESDTIDMLASSPASRSLPRRREVGTVVPMDPIPKASPTKGSRVSASRTRKPTPFQEALQRINLSIPQWVAAQNAEIAVNPELQRRLGTITVEKVKSWCKRSSRDGGDGGRRVPYPWAQRIAEQLPDVPATEASWPNGIKP